MEREELLSKRMHELNKMAEEDLKLEDFELREKTLAAPNIKIKWIRVQAEEQRLLKLLEEKLDEYRRKLMTEKYNISIAQFQKEIEIDKDDGVRKIRKAIEDQKDVVRFAEGIVRIAQGFGFDIKNAIDIIKLEQ